MKLFNREPNDQVVLAKTEPQAREKLIKQNEQTILKIASKTCMKYISKSDDEWSVALCAFSRAIDSFEPERGNFMGFATTVIQRELIDYHRKEEQYSSELMVSPATFEGNAQEEDGTIAHTIALANIDEPNSNIPEEISALSAELAAFGFSFMDLPEVSPKQSRTRKNCLKAAFAISENKSLYEKMLQSHHLPSTEISAQTNLPVKLLDKYRRYIITSAIILSEDYPYLASYLKPLKERTNP